MVRFSNLRRQSILGCLRENDVCESGGGDVQVIRFQQSEEMQKEVQRLEAKGWRVTIRPYHLIEGDYLVTKWSVEIGAPGVNKPGKPWSFGFGLEAEQVFWEVFMKVSLGEVSKVLA